MCRGGGMFQGSEAAARQSGIFSVAFFPERVKNCWV